jgi:hypothetical protein
MSEIQPDPAATVLAGHLERALASKAVNRSQRTLIRWEKQGLPVVRCGNLRLYNIEKLRAFVLGEVVAPTPRKPGRPRKSP